MSIAGIYWHIFEQELYREKDREMWMTEHQQSAVLAVVAAVRADCIAACESLVLDRERPFDNGCYTCAQAIRTMGSADCEVIERLDLRLTEANMDKEAMSARIFNLEQAILKICQANDAFEKDTGLKIHDRLSTAIEWGRSKIALPVETNGEPLPL